MEIFPEQHAALIYLSKADQAQFAISKGDTEGFVNYPLSIKGIIFSTFIREDDGLIKLSFRSQKSFPCNKFAANFFSGGGHLNASGGEFHGKMEDAIAIFKNGLMQYEAKLKESEAPKNANFAN
jgi:phosphoesterase RecJ-like protein